MTAWRRRAVTLDRARPYALASPPVPPPLRSVINPEVAVPLAVALATPVAILWRWFQHRERLAELAAERKRLPADDARLTRLEQAVEAIAVEVERVGEGQRFLTRALTGRGVVTGSDIPAAESRVLTPH